MNLRVSGNPPELFAAATLEDATSGEQSPRMYQLVEKTASFSPAYVFPVNAAGARTYRLLFRSSNAEYAWTASNGMITALYVPFNGSGVSP